MKSISVPNVCKAIAALSHAIPHDALRRDLSATIQRIAAGDLTGRAAIADTIRLFEKVATLART